MNCSNIKSKDNAFSLWNKKSIFLILIIVTIESIKNEAGRPKALKSNVPALKIVPFKLKKRGTGTIKNSAKYNLSLKFSLTSII